MDILKMSKWTLLFFLSLVMIASTTFYSVSSNYQISLKPAFDELAHAVYQQKAKQTGWNRLYIYANPMKDLMDQHRGAGFLQGYTTYTEIYAAYNNFVKSILKNGSYSQIVQQYVDRQLDYIDLMIANNPKDIFWQYAAAYIQQFRYMHRGYLTRIHQQSRMDMMLSFSQIYYLPYIGDYQDVKDLNGFVTKTTKEGNCNGYIKLINDELFIGHGTHNIYPFLLRIFKTFNFPTRDPRVGSETITFSSRPGDMISKDDFYVLSSGLKVLQTSLQNNNPQNVKQIAPQSVPSWLRTCIAVNLAHSGQQWIDYFVKERSGTHNNQWIIIDKSQIQNKKNVVLFLEEAFSIYQVVDMTETLFKQGFVGSYNMPKSKNIYDKLGYGSGNFSETYETDPRALILAKYNKFINNEEDMKKWLTLNEEKDPKSGLAPRYDLAQNSSKLFGMTDTKIITPLLQSQNYVEAISGPPTSSGRFAAFDWRNWPNDVYQGLPIVYNFTWQKIPINIEKIQQVKE